jgi:hypothetical protein
MLITMPELNPQEVRSFETNVIDSRARPQSEKEDVADRSLRRRRDATTALPALTKFRPVRLA